MVSPIPPSVVGAGNGENGRPGLLPKGNRVDRSASPGIRGEGGVLHQQQTALPGSTSSLIKLSDRSTDNRRSGGGIASLISPSSSNASELSIERRGTPTSVSSPTFSSSSWADSVDENGPPSAGGSRPDWAQMPSTNGEMQLHPATAALRQTPPVGNSILGYPGGMNIGMIHLTSDFVGTLHPHTVVPNHTPNSTKRSVSIPDDRGGVSKESVVIPMPVHPPLQGSLPLAAAAASNWTPHHSHPAQYNPQAHHHHQQQHAYQSTMGGAIRGQPAQTLQYSHAQLNHNNSSANGLLRTPTHTPPHNRMQVFAPRGIPVARSIMGGGGSHPPAAAPSQVLCYNCGKRGHVGSSCPGVTVDVDNSTCKCVCVCVCVCDVTPSLIQAPTRSY